MRLYDSHCHLDFEAFDGGRDAVVERARAAGVRAILVPGADLERSEGLAALAARYPEVRVAVGLHPLYVRAPLGAEGVAGLADRLAERAVALSAVAIGECGLDGRAARAGGAGLDAQRAVLDAHLDAARALGLPVVLHGVHAHGPMLEALEARGRLPAGGVLHGFTGPAELVPRYAALGLSFGLGPAITRPSAKKPRAAAMTLPIERILVETDAPDLERGGNEPAKVAAVLAALAALRGEPEERLAEATYENAAALFGAPDRAPRRVC